MPNMTRSEQLRAKYRKASGRARGREERLDRDLIDQLLEQTHDQDVEMRSAAVQALCPCHVQSNIDRVWNRLLALVDDPAVQVRSLILHTLCDGSPREREAQVVAALETMYNDPDRKLRRRVRYVLAQYRRTGKINIL